MVVEHLWLLQLANQQLWGHLLSVASPSLCLLGIASVLCASQKYSLTRLDCAQATWLNLISLVETLRTDSGKLNDDDASSARQVRSLLLRCRQGLYLQLIAHNFFSSLASSGQCQFLSRPHWSMVSDGPWRWLKSKGHTLWILPQSLQTTRNTIEQ
jgi:hypothetical protein